MILKGNQRGGGRQLAIHLLNESDNEHVQVHELRGFVADDLQQAFHEAYAVSRGTRAKQFLFSLSLNPPPDAKVSTDKFERAIETIESKLGLENQPRAIVFHEKEGRRHAHVVWSRIDAEQMKAINLPFYKLKLREVSKELYFEHGWQMPRGLADSRERDPATYNLAEWQQAKRSGHDPKALKMMFQECWAISDGRKAFASALQVRGYTLACGDRRGHVAVDYRGEVYAIAKYVGLRTKDVNGRLGDPTKLPSIEQAKKDIAARMTQMLQRHIRETESKLETKAAASAFRKADIIRSQRDQRKRLEQLQKSRWDKEVGERAQRYTTGMRGLWDRFTGRRSRIKQQNELETLEAYQRDCAEMERLIFRHIDERQLLHQQIRQVRQAHVEQVAELHRDIGGYKHLVCENLVGRGLNDAKSRIAKQRKGDREIGY